MSVTRSGFRNAADCTGSRARRPIQGRHGSGVLGVVLGVMTLGLRDESTNSISWSAIGITALALGLRVLPRRWIR